MPRVRALLALAAFAAIGVGSFQTMYVRIFTADAAALRALYTELPFRRLPGLRPMLEEVDRRTPPGARIALWAPFREWQGGYGYAFYRAPFLLPGKRVLPMLEPDVDVPTGRYLAEAEYVACWRSCPPLSGFAVVWRGTGGELMARRR